MMAKAVVSPPSPVSRIKPRISSDLVAIKLTWIFLKYLNLYLDLNDHKMLLLTLKFKYFYTFTYSSSFKEINVE